jgi:hypothetical protein
MPCLTLPALPRPTAPNYALPGRDRPALPCPVLPARLRSVASCHALQGPCLAGTAEHTTAQNLAATSRAPISPTPHHRAAPALPCLANTEPGQTGPWRTAPNKDEPRDAGHAELHRAASRFAEMNRATPCQNPIPALIAPAGFLDARSVAAAARGRRERARRCRAVRYIGIRMPAALARRPRAQPIASSGCSRLR